MVAERTRWWIVVVGMLIVALWENVALRHLALENSRLSKESATLTQQLKEERAAGDDFAMLIGANEVTCFGKATEDNEWAFREAVRYAQCMRSHVVSVQDFMFRGQMLPVASVPEEKGLAK